MRRPIEMKKAWPAIEPEELRGRYVGFWARVWASCIDSVLILALTYPLLLLSYDWTLPESLALVEGPVHFVLSWVFPAVVIVVFWVFRSATPGKMAVGASIVDATTGGTPSKVQLVKRYLGYYLSAFPLGWGFFRMAFDSRKQGWHDKFSGTVVVYQPRKLAREPETPTFHQSGSTSPDVWEKAGHSCLAPSKM